MVKNMSKLHFLIREYINEYYPLFGPRKVGEKLGMHETSITAYAKKNNLVLNKINGIGLEIPEFKYDLDFSHKFNCIDEKLAYWIGFFWADGNINRHSSLVIEIIEKDGEELRELFNSVYPFSITSRQRRGRKRQIIFRVSSKKISNLLESLGKYANSSESHEKIFGYLKEKKLQVSFLRGLIDGDGSFYWNEKNKYGQFTLASNYEQDWSFLCEYLKEFNPHIERDIKSNSKSSVLRITGRDNLIGFIKFMNYEFNDIGLKRKTNYANNIIKFYLDNQPKDYRKHVLQCTKDGKIIKEWNSSYEASKNLHISQSAIGNCLCGISKTSSGYIWKYK